MRALILLYTNQHMKLEVPSFNDSKDMHCAFLSVAARCCLQWELRHRCAVRCWAEHCCAMCCDAFLHVVPAKVNVNIHRLLQWNSWYMYTSLPTLTGVA